MNDEAQWEAHVAEARVHLRTRNSERLSSAAADMIALQPQDAFGYYFLAEAACLDGRLKDAIKRMHRVLELSPTYDLAMYRLAQYLIADGKTQEAEKQLQRAIELDPMDPDYWVLLGEISLEEDDFKGAARYAKRALDLDASHVNARQLLAKSLKSEGPAAYGKRLEILDQALREDPEDADVWGDRAVLLLSMKRYEEAEDCGRQALALDPTNQWYRKTLYTTIKHRSWIYKFLRWPGDLVTKGFEWIDRMPWYGWILLCMVGIGARLFFFLLILGAVWLICFYPPLKLYEWMSLSEIRRQAQEVEDAKRRVPWLPRMPLPARIPLFLGLVAAFWYGLTRLVKSEDGRDAVGIGVAVLVLCAVVLCLLGWVLVVRDSRRARRRRKRNEGLSRSK